MGENDNIPQMTPSFENICRKDENGNEYWSSRDLCGGDVKNTGIELALNWNDQIGSDFSYNVGINGAYNKNAELRKDHERE